MEAPLLVTRTMYGTEEDTTFLKPFDDCIGINNFFWIKKSLSKSLHMPVNL